MTRCFEDILSTWTSFLPKSNLILLAPADTIGEKDNKTLSGRGLKQCDALCAKLGPLLPLIKRNCVFVASADQHADITLLRSLSLSIEKLVGGPSWGDYYAPESGYAPLLPKDKVVIHCSDPINLSLGLRLSGVLHEFSEPLETLFVKNQDETLKVLAYLSCLRGLAGPTIQ